MAAYSELFDLWQKQSMVERMMIAVAVMAETIRLEDPATAKHIDRIRWARAAITAPDASARQMLLLMLAQNKDFPAAQIEAVNDVTLQSALSAAIELVT